MRRAIILIILGMLLMAPGCGNGTGERGTPGPLPVVATIYPLADIVKELGGDAVAVDYLLPAGASPHTYEPTAEQVRLIAEAELFVLVGGGLDDWALRLAEAAGKELTVLVLAERMDLLEAAESRHLEHRREADHHHGQEDEKGHEDGEHHHHGPLDPHIWLDPLLVRDEICPLLADALKTLRPGQAGSFAANLASYREKLTLLDEEISETLAGVRGRNFIAFHSAWQYFARRYGINEIAVIARFPGQEPSAGWLAELVELARVHQVKAVFVEPQFSPLLARQIAGEMGVATKVVDPLGGSNVPGRETYLDLMRFNAASFAEGLR